MAHFDPTDICFLNRGDEINEGNNVIDTETSILHVLHRGLKSKSELLFVLNLCELDFFVLLDYYY